MLAKIGISIARMEKIERRGIYQMRLAAGFHGSLYGRYFARVLLVVCHERNQLSDCLASPGFGHPVSHRRSAAVIVITRGILRIQIDTNSF